MPDRNRDGHDGIVALAFVTFALIFCLIGYFEGFDQGQGDRESVYTDQHHENAQDRIKDRCIALTGAHQAECIKEAIETSGEHQRAEQDVTAQQQMAMWARWMLGATVVMAAITMFGVIFVWQTLVATREIAKETKEIGDSQSRAWLSVECSLGQHEIQTMQNREDAFSINAFAAVQNHGHSPAADIAFYAEAVFLNEFSETPIEMLRRFCEGRVSKGGFVGEAVFPGSTIELSHMVVLRLSDIEAEIANKDFKAVFPYLLTCTAYKCCHTGNIYQTGTAHMISNTENRIPQAIGPYRDDWLTRPIRLTRPGLIITK